MRKDIFLPLLAVIGGGAGFALRRWQLATALDEETMLMRVGAPATYALLGLLAVLAVALFLLVRGGEVPEGYPQAFRCPSAGYMTVMTAGSFLLFAAAALGLLVVRDQLNQGESFPMMALLAALLCLPGGAAGLLLGKGNYQDALPQAYPLLATLPAYAVLPWLVALYQANSRQPVTMLYVITLVGAVCAELGFYGGACFAFGRPRPKLCLFSSLMGTVLLLTSLADGPNRFFAVTSLAFVLLLLAQSYALLRNCFGPRRPQKPDQSQN
jgi:hypothetical protein